MFSNKLIDNFLVRVMLSLWMLVAVSIRLRVNIYEPFTKLLRVYGLWSPTELLQNLQVLIGF